MGDGSGAALTGPAGAEAEAEAGAAALPVSDETLASGPDAALTGWGALRGVARTTGLAAGAGEAEPAEGDGAGS